MKMKDGIKLAAFAAVFLVLFAFVNRLFNPGEIVRNEKVSFYEEPENSIEVMFCGSSSMLRAASPMELYQEYGIVSYSMATVLQAPPVTEFTVKEALKYQKPKVVVLNMESAAMDYDYMAREAYIHSSLDPFRFSLDKLKSILAIHAHDSNQQVVDYLFPVVRYHDAWDTLFDGFTQLEHEESYQKGYVGMKTSVQVSPSDSYMEYSGSPVELNEDSMKYYNEAIQTCVEQGIPVLLVKLPRMIWTLEEHEALEVYAKEMGVDYLDFNEAYLWEKTGIDIRYDFYDDNHLNHRGSVKLMKVLGEYLADNYDLSDKRNQDGYEFWENSILEYEKEYRYCIHELEDQGKITYTVSSSEEMDKRNYRWEFWVNGQNVETKETTEPYAEFTIEEADEYYVICTIVEENDVQTKVQTDSKVY